MISGLKEIRIQDSKELTNCIHGHKVYIHTKQIQDKNKGIVGTNIAPLFLQSEETTEGIH